MSIALPPFAMLLVRKLVISFLKGTSPATTTCWQGLSHERRLQQSLTLAILQGLCSNYHNHNDDRDPSARPNPFVLTDKPHSLFFIIFLRVLFLFTLRNGTELSSDHTCLLQTSRIRH
ncbi:hypothetical protein E4U13_008082 [Claviceps humidiphila]|uniref:Secreted protein n=1 Tax=Claviceps humidiphila TaxID=1294629 RepID=A0A9P7TSD1_9HYPO|nr:hypothetical protein E4U13_008082 [Claviceps humidiphila]